MIYATSEAGQSRRSPLWNDLLMTGNPMVPISYQDMEDTVTGATERRKVAKPDGV